MRRCRLPARDARSSHACLSSPNQSCVHPSSFAPLPALQTACPVCKNPSDPIVTGSIHVLISTKASGKISCVLLLTTVLPPGRGPCGGSTIPALRRSRGCRIGARTRAGRRGRVKAESCCYRPIRVRHAQCSARTTDSRPSWRRGRAGFKGRGRCGFGGSGSGACGRGACCGDGRGARSGVQSGGRRRFCQSGRDAAFCGGAGRQVLPANQTL